jgi:hypothetical protein
MNKIVAIFLCAIFVVVIFFIVKNALQLSKDFNNPKSTEELAFIDFFKKHDKKIGKAFVVDSVQYSVTSFKYKTKIDTTTILVDVAITNTKAQTNKITNGLFMFSGGANHKIYYPLQFPFSLEAYKSANIKLVYYLPENILPSVLYYLNINSKSDSTQNGVVTLCENYREGG